MGLERKRQSIMRPIRVCFVSLYSYPVFAGNSNLVFGGSEVRASLLTKGIAADPRFFDVSVVSCNLPTFH
jgi:hypothetical protein